MRRERLSSLLLLCVLMLVPFSLASFSTELITVQETVFPGEVARFELYITNQLSTADRYIVSSEQVSYLLGFDPRPGDVGPGETALFGLEIAPSFAVNFGTYRVPIRVRSQTSGEVQELTPLIRIRDPDREAGVYNPSVALGISFPEVIDPRDEAVLRINLRNRNARVYDERDPLTIVIDGELFSRSYPTQLGGVHLEGERASEQRFTLNPFQPPSDHSLSVEVRVGNRTISSERVQYRISEFSDLREESSVQSSLFRYTTRYTVTNYGNSLEDARVEHAVSAFQRLFFSASQEHRVETVDGQSVAVITLPVASQESVTVEVVENYRILAVLVLLIILSVIGYFLFRSPLVVGKEAILAGSPDDGVSEIKVRLFIMNRSSKTMRNLRVIDRISGMAEVVKEDSLGTVKPTKVSKKKDQGTLIRWDVDQLEPFEERIISYRVKTPLKLVGDVTLPAVKVKYDLPSGRERTSHSNEVAMAKGE